ncbi:topoisomerase II-binding protein 1 [Naegleria gruberi]|uniref:Topoisomerase II-binding protein 1 n=1 Tax=Naegleria gruberi TaxID=5762 RepID=D2V2T9_NAEGR|nr:topoisomerase II-binding protein 1 [Naegleria gruberi]EFC49118.1 topoisomerase II-binding protein 1 [Naegleria gruberi]|eukprot:XP_002681862.1 topoisomerase II-binding protein 1 [Naegleria gruberi strain NEG-M]
MPPNKSTTAKLFTSLCFFLSSSIPKNEKEKLIKSIEKHDGTISNDLDTNGITHIISVEMETNSENENIDTLNSSQVKNPDRFIISPQFVYTSIKENKLCDEENFLLCYPFVFYNLVFTCTRKISNIASVAFMVTFLGGKFLEQQEEEKITHIITTSDDTETVAPSSSSDHVIIVSFEWLKLCFSKRIYLDEKNYLVGKNQGKYISIHQAKTLFQSLTFYIVNYPPEFISILQREICSNGGKVLQSRLLKDNVKIDYLITRYACNEPYTLKNVENITTAQWIDDSLRESRLIPISEKIIYRPLKSNNFIKGFENKKISITGFEGAERSDMIYLIKQTGAIYTGDLNKQNDFLIVKSFDLVSKKIEKAKTWELTILSPDFIFDSISHWRMMNTGLYTLETATTSLDKKRKLPQEDKVPEKPPQQKKKVKKERVFKLSLHPSEEEEIIEKIENLGAKVCSTAVDTHLIISEIKRTHKFMTSCAKGSWVLKPSYIKDSVGNNEFLDEKNYEWFSDEFTTKGIWMGVGRKWRQFREEHGHGPFKGWIVYIHLLELSGPPRELFQDVITAGDGIVSETLDSNVTLAILDDDVKATHDSETRTISELKIPAVKGAFLLDYFTLKQTPNKENYVVF